MEGIVRELGPLPGGENMTEDELLDRWWITNPKVADVTQLAEQIAQKKLGNAKRWPEIVALNKKKIPNPKKLKVGITLTLPAK